MKLGEIILLLMGNMHLFLETVGLILGFVADSALCKSASHPSLLRDSVLFALFLLWRL